MLALRCVFPSTQERGWEGWLGVVVVGVWRGFFREIVR